MPSKKSQEDNLADEPPTSINPYEILEIEEKATAEQIKYAYRKQALKHHPDKALPSQADEANKKFQEVAFAYAILSDERRRRRYDQTGNTSESLDLEDDDFDWVSYYKEQFKGMVDSNSIEKLKKEYQGSEDEKHDILQALEESEGKMNHIYHQVMFSNVLDDDERIRAIIDKAIEDGEAEAWPKYVNEPKTTRRSRWRTAEKEAKEARELAEELEVDSKMHGVNDEDDEGDGAEEKTETKKKANKKTKKQQPAQSDLAALIQQRQSLSSGFLDRLEEKYARENNAGSGKKGKGKKRPAEEEPPEEAFAAVGARMKETKEAKKRKIPDNEGKEEKKEEEKKPKKKRITKKARAQAAG